MILSLSFSRYYRSICPTWICLLWTDPIGCSGPAHSLGPVAGGWGLDDLDIVVLSILQIQVRTLVLYCAFFFPHSITTFFPILTLWPRINTLIV